MAADEAKVTGSLFRSYVEALQTMGMRAAVRAAVSPRVQALIDQPPLHRDWLDGSEVREVFKALVDLRGLEGVRRLGYECMRASILQHLRPMIQTTLGLHGRSPAVLFARLDTLAKPFFRGISFEYSEAGPREGVILLRSTYPMGSVQFSAWEGSLSALYDEVGTPGVIEPATVAEDHLSGTMRARW
jgi:hypothetical protein